jgi:hypothetical protein
MADPEPIKENKEDYFITRLALTFNIRNKVSQEKFKKSFDGEENKYFS